MPNTFTLTSADVSDNQFLSVGYPINAVTVYPDVLTVYFDVGNTNEIDDEMREIEHAAMVDFWKFENMD